nr:PREDICTED: protein FAM184A isoform X3 [Latimeria chalumnae]|eukprot:XP_014346228.1 PREDICTED: protein FAM184A isoform X3 [Latimeria chalumnae]
MATGMSWQHYYSSAGNPSSGAAKFNSAAASPMAMSHPMGKEYNQDLHLKMSKKIAQLTKVIYALNTKNDEHEAAIQALKDAHEEEIQQILAETREKILQYKTKVEEEGDLKRRIHFLEESLEQHERVKRQALAEFEVYKHRVEDMQLCMEAQHTQRVVTMSREVEEIRRNFEEKLRSFVQQQAQSEKEKRAVLEDLKAAHKLEIQEFLMTQQNQNENVTHDQQELEQLHRAEVEELSNKLEDLKLERKQIVEEYETKLGKAQAFYEHELEALRRSQQQTAESLHVWKQKEGELRREFQSQETVLQKNLGKLKMELQIVQEEAVELREKCQNLQTALAIAESNIQVLQSQLEDANREALSSLAKRREMEGELEAARDCIQQQSTELLLKASHIGTLQANQMTNEATIRNLESERSKIKDKMFCLEEEINLLQTKNHGLDERQRQQIQNLEKALKEAQESQRDSYEQEVMNLRNRFEEEVVQLKEAHARTVTELSQKHQMALETTQNNASREKKKLQMEMEQAFEKERLYLEEEKNQLRQQLENLGEELTAKLSAANQEVCRLQDLVKESDQGLGSAEEHISSLKAAQGNLQKELDATRARLRETSNSLSSVQGELEQQKQQHEARLAAAKLEEQLQLENLACELEVKWSETLRLECTKLREELKQQHQEDKKSALTQLSQLREQEMSATREGWQKKVEDLLDQRHCLGEALHKSISNISLLKQNLEMQLSQSQNSLQQLQVQFNQERQRLSEELQEREEEYQLRQKSLEEAHMIAFKNLEDIKDREYKELEERLQQQHAVEMEDLEEAHRLKMDMLRQEMEQELQTLRFELEDEGKAMLASLRSELNHQHAASIDQIRHSHQQEVAAAQMELERALELSRRQEKELLGRITDLQDEIRHQDHRISELDNEVLSLHEDKNTLTKELEYKGQEVLKIRSEANQQIRIHEQEISKKHEKELDEMTAAHIREKQSMLVDFNEAQELLKDKISALRISLEEVEEKYQNRESRPEDLQFISDLKDMIAERDQLIKKLMDDKKFYQLELVNRETNFNKVFNANPNVGVINPLVKQKRKNDKSVNRFVSVPNLSALEPGGVGNGHPQPNRLEPIPNSPVHDIEFNCNKPLPQPVPLKEPKKFLRADSSCKEPHST